MEDGKPTVHGCYVHKSTRMLNKLIENGTSKKTPLLGISIMPPPLRGDGSAEHKVRHRRIEEEKFIEETYKFGKMLGQGSFGIVVEATNLKTGERWAVKKVNKEKAGSSAITLLEREVSILKKVKHDHIIQLEEIFETSKKVYLVMELCELGELRTILFKKDPLSEVSTRHIIMDLAQAIMYLHRKGIVHRDLKLENILIAGCTTTEEEHPLYDIKLTDFGLSVEKGGAGSESLLHSSCGTPVYMAPEVILNHDYSQQCDTWSIGVILFALMSQKFPFMADKEEKLFELIKKGKVEFSKPLWEDKSSSVKSLIRNLLTLDPAHRYTANDIITNPWVLGNTDGSAPNPTNVLDMMKEYANEIANNCNEEDEFAGNSDDMNQDDFDEDMSRRPDTTGSTTSSLTGKPHSKKYIKSAPLATQNHPSNVSPHRTLTHLHPPPDAGGRRVSLPTNLKPPLKKSTVLAGSPRKIYDNKTLGKQTSPVSSAHPSKSTRSPAHSAKDRGNSLRGSMTDTTQSNGRLKPDQSASRLSARPHTPGSHRKPQSPQPPHSPLLNHRQTLDGGRSGAQSANKTRKKKLTTKP